MLFTSLAFLPFFVATFAAYWLLPWHRARTWLLLAASFYFYASWNHWLALLIAVTSTVDYAIGRALDASESVRRSRGLLLASVVMNLGLLAYFKYANFFLDSLTHVLHAAGWPTALPTLQILLPIGISFYTFEAINYAADVYQRRTPAERSLPNFLLFITFFPHLVAGPIVRAKDFLPQVRRFKRWDWMRLQLGANYFLLGLIKKLVIADRLALLVDPVFAAPEQYRTAVLWLAVLSYALQIYCDFSGYSDMAVGLAHAFGFKLARNFNLPYLAANVSEFWRRWHISLSTWLRDYLFIPLGGSRGTPGQTLRNLIITMALGGLWHGASWTFVLWGLLHGGYLAVHRRFQGFCENRPRWQAVLRGMPGTAARVGLTFLAVALAWVLFRAPTLGDAWTIYARMFWPSPGMAYPFPSEGAAMILALAAAGHAIGRWRRAGRVARDLPAPIQGFAYAALWACVLVLTPDGARPFIYFQF
jgi:alginate O-acetyltransferase complex protein AlgI